MTIDIHFLLSLLSLFKSVVGKIDSEWWFDENIWGDWFENSLGDHVLVSREENNNNWI